METKLWILTRKGANCVQSGFPGLSGQLDSGRCKIFTFRDHGISFPGFDDEWEHLQEPPIIIIYIAIRKRVFLVNACFTISTTPFQCCCTDEVPKDSAVDGVQPAVFVDPASQGTTCPVDGRGDQLDFAFRAGAGGDDFEAEAVSSGAISSAQCLTASLVIGFQEFTLFMALFMLLLHVFEAICPEMSESCVAPQ